MHLRSVFVFICIALISSSSIQAGLLARSAQLLLMSTCLSFLLAQPGHEPMAGPEIVHEKVEKGTIRFRPKTRLTLVFFNETPDQRKVASWLNKAARSLLDDEERKARVLQTDELHVDVEEIVVRPREDGESVEVTVTVGPVAKEFHTVVKKADLESGGKISFPREKKSSWEGTIEFEFHVRLLRSPDSSLLRCDEIGGYMKVTSLLWNPPPHNILVKPFALFERVESERVDSDGTID